MAHRAGDTTGTSEIREWCGWGSRSPGSPPSVARFIPWDLGHPPRAEEQPRIFRLRCAALLMNTVLMGRWEQVGSRDSWLVCEDVFHVAGLVCSLRCRTRSRRKPGRL